MSGEHFPKRDDVELKQLPSLFPAKRMTGTMHICGGHMRNVLSTQVDFLIALFMDQIRHRLYQG